MDIGEKVIGGVLALGIGFYLIAYLLIPSLTAGNYSDVGGVDLSFIVSIVGILVIVGMAYGAYKHFNK
jgi:hypothetical protein